MACVGKMPGFRFHSRHATRGENVSAMETEVLCLQTLFVRVKHFICSPIILSTLNWCKKRKVGQRCKFSDKGNNYSPKCCSAAVLQAACCRCRSLQQHLITITRAEQAPNHQASNYREIRVNRSDLNPLSKRCMTQ